MKLNTILCASIAALGLAGAAQAQTYLRLTGSTAYRQNVHNAITDLAWDSEPTAGYDSSTLGASTHAIFKGSIGGTQYIIKTSWSGSEAGIESVAGGLTVAFLADTTPVSLISPASGTGTDAGTASVAGSNVAENIAADAAFSDTFNGTSQFYNTTLVLNTAGSTFFPALTAATTPVTGLLAGNGIVGIVPFKFCASLGSPLTAITAQQAQDLYSTGVISQSVFTGLAADKGTKGATSNGKWVFAAGRNPDSGTRLTAMSEIGLGALTNVKQYQPSDSASAQITSAGGSVAKNLAFPAGVVNQLNVGVFNNGYGSGGNLAKAINNNTSAMVNGSGASLITGGSYVAYLGVNDADAQIANAVIPGNTTNGSTTVLITPGTNYNAFSGYGVKAGVSVTGAGIPAATTVASVSADGKSIVLSNAATATATGATLTFTFSGITELAYNGVFLGKQSQYNNSTALTYGQYSFWGYEHLYFSSSASAGAQTAGQLLATQLYNSDAVVLFPSMQVSRASDGATVQ